MPTSRLRHTIGGFAVCVLFAAGCGSRDDTSAEGEPPDESTTSTTTAPDENGTPDKTTTTTTEAPALSASYRGVSESAIEIGVLLFDLDVILELGVDVGYGDQTQHFQVLVDEINAGGGILGRQIEPHYRLISPVDPAQADQVCLEFTEDLEVFAVLGTHRPPDNVLCYTETGDTPFIGAPTGDLTDEVFERSVAPFIFPGRLPSRTDGAILAAIEADDAYDGGVVAVHGADGARVESLAGQIDDLGTSRVITTVELADEADQTELATELDRFIEIYKSEGVTHVVNLGNNVALLAAWNRAAFGVPLYTTSVDVLADFIYDQGATDDELRQVRLISSETGSDLYLSGHEPTVECIDRWNGLRPDEPAVPNATEDDLQNFGVVIVACSSVDAFVRAATAAGTELTVESFTAGLDSIGNYEPPGQRFASLTSTKWDASDSAKLFRWSEDDGKLVAAEDLQVG